MRISDWSSDVCSSDLLVAGAFGALTEVYGDLLRAAGAAERLSELLHAEPAIAPPAHPRPLPQPATGTLEFAAVEFRYPTRPDTAALHDFSLAIRPRETVAIVGPSGAGKSDRKSTRLNSSH